MTACEVRGTCSLSSMNGLQVQEVAQAAKLDHSDSAGSSVMDQSMQRTTTSFKNRSGFRGVRRVCQKTLLVCLLTELFSDVLCCLKCCACGTLMHHSCKCMKRLLCDASGLNGCVSVITLLSFCIMMSVDGWHCSRLRSACCTPLHAYKPKCC